ncbi:MAG: CPBP family intramembrane metalloprotease [Alistipes sp.]|nr:CPBP family intramembrane metalloprotease [Alistipes sp.]
MTENNEKELTAPITIEPQPSDSHDDDILPEGDNSQRRRHFRWYDVIVILLAFFLSQGVGAFIAVKLGITPPDSALFSDPDLDISEAAKSMQARFVAVTFIFAIVLYFISLRVYSLCRRWTSHISFRAPSWGAPFRLLCGYLLLWAVSITIEPLTQILPASESVLGQGGWLLLSAVVLAPLLEEVVFRGYIAGGLQYAYGPICAWLVSSIVFGIAHGEPATAVNATFCGLVLGFYYMRYRSLTMVIMLHAMNNLTACFLSVIDLNNTPMSELLGGGKLYWSIYTICAIISLLALVRMYKLLKKLKSNKSAY